MPVRSSVSASSWLVFVVLAPVSWSTFDMTLGHVEFLSDHLTTEECRGLVVILMGYESDEDVPKVSCLRNLIDWDRTLGRGQSSVMLRIPLKRVGREDLADRLDALVEKEMKFEFDNSPFHLRESKSRELAPGEKEYAEGETLSELVDEYEKEVAEDEKGTIESLTSYTGGQIFIFFVAIISVMYLLYTVFLSRIKCAQDFNKWIGENAPVYCLGILPKNIDKPHYDPEIHTLHSDYF